MLIFLHRIIADVDNRFQWPADEKLVLELQDDGKLSPGNNLTLAQPVSDEKSQERKKQL